MKEKLKTLIHAIMLSGIFVFVLGLYFMFIKTGLPYQDPTPEMTIRWMAYNTAGEACALYGMSIFVLGLVGRIVYKFIKWKQESITA